MKRLIVDKKYDQKKLNKFLLDNIPGLTFGIFSNLLRKKDIKINGKRVNKDVSIFEGDEVLVYISDELLDSKTSINLDIVFEDDNILIINKPYSLEVTGSNSLTTIVNESYNNSDFNYMPCHRIDRNTTGLILFAKNQERIKNFVGFNGEKIYYSLDDVKILEQTKSYSKFEYKNDVYELNVEGEYNIENSLSAIELGQKLGLTKDEIKKGLYSYRPIEKRWEEEEIQGLKFINDSYNANPESVKASVKTFVELYKNPVVVLGDMKELGGNEIEYHREVGKYLSKLNKNVKYLTVGNLAKEIGKELENNGFEAHYFNSNKDASCYILENLNKDNTIFLKASRSMQFEEILDNIRRGICKL